MGYYSDVAIQVTKTKYEKMLKRVIRQDEINKDFENLIEEQEYYNDLLTRDVKEFTDDGHKSVVITINDVKWYENATVISIIIEQLQDEVGDEDDEYVFIRIGEDLNDYDEIDTLSYGTRHISVERKIIVE